MKTLIAQRPGQYLVQTGPQRGRILDARGYHEEMFLQSLLARGYWEKTSVSVEDAERLLRHSIAKFDEAKHPREPGGSSEGGQFTESGRTGSAESLPTLAAQAKTGIAAVEKLIPEAVKTADFSGPGFRVEWDVLTPEQQDQTRARFFEEQRPLVVQTAFENSTLTRTLIARVENTQPEMLQQEVLTRVKAFLAEPYTTMKNIDPSTLVPLDKGFDASKIRNRDGSELTYPEMQNVSDIWVHQWVTARSAIVKKVRMSPEFKPELDAEVERYLTEKWDQRLTDLAKSTYAQTYGIIVASKGAPVHWVTGVAEGTMQDDDYARTHAVALRATILRTDEIRQERALKGGAKPVYTVEESVTSTEAKPNFVAKNSSGRIIASSNSLENAKRNADQWAEEEQSKTLAVPSERLVDSIWQEWKRSSTSGLGLALQLASARELGGVHRLTPEQETEAEFAADGVGGIEVVQAYVRAQWEVTQTIMAKAGEDKLQVYRGLMLPGAEVNATKHQVVDKLGQQTLEPTNIKMVPPRNEYDTTPPYVEFDFDGVHFSADKVKLVPKWIELSPERRAEFKEVWWKQRGMDDITYTDTTAADKTKTDWMDRFDMMEDGAQDALVREYVRLGHFSVGYESDATTVHRRLLRHLDNSREAINLRVKLPELVLQRTGAASTTGTASVANSWGGVGGLPPDPTRVVMRLEVPPTSVLALPVYGANVHEEHESVIIGTKDRWLWDAWRNTAPEFGSQSIVSTIKKSEPKSKPLVIDMWEAEQGPHWLSGLRSQPPVKKPTPPKK